MYILLKSILTKKILFSAIGMLLACSVSAQEFFGPKSDYYMNDNFYEPAIGFEAGVNFSNAVGYGHKDFKASTLTGFNAGVTFHLPIAYPLAFAPEILYSQRGYTATSTSGNFTQRTGFIDVPLLAKFKVGSVINLLIGPQVSFLLAKQNTFNSGFIAATEQYYNESDGRAVYIDGVLGASVDITQTVNLHVRYTIDLQQTGANGNIYVPGYVNQSWQMGLGFIF